MQFVLEGIPYQNYCLVSKTSRYGAERELLCWGKVKGKTRGQRRAPEPIIRIRRPSSRTRTLK